MRGPRVPGARLTVRARLDRRSAEALQLEMGRAARHLGLSVADLRIRRVEGGASSSRATPRARPRSARGR
jgi:hypothetical protein